MSTSFKVHVGNLNFSTNEDKLRSVFSQFGNILSITIPQTKTNHSRGFAFIEFQDENSAMEAINKLDETNLDDRIIKVSMSNWVPKPKPEPKEEPSKVTLDDVSDEELDDGQIRLNLVFVGNLSHQTTEEQLRKIFGKYGEITKIRIPLKDDQPRGIAFIEFKNIDDAGNAVEALDGTEIDQRKITVNISTPSTPSIQSSIVNEDVSVKHHRRRKHRYH
ncbi:Nuclear localization sequence-binding protein [Histomonas meleagridis]|uniref:Nuclear localization sequence-binding protein n=1 Tax=Histomonas meleagridis TaxID=135588 RepID=UPI00355A6FB7|nr:Nuclear localization sequence-binding protein [Histomonas meleagridis]KAH0804021.1 Nuclear localization sequence-binding protein [Histomonas meleagridis]